VFLAVILLLPALLFSQKERRKQRSLTPVTYKYVYEFRAERIPLTYSVTIKDSSLEGKELLQFATENQYGRFSYYSIILTTGNERRFFSPDPGDTVSMAFVCDSFTIVFEEQLYDEKIPAHSFQPNKVMLFTVRPGIDRSLYPSTIYSREPLNPEEIESIRHAFSRGWEDEHPYILEKRCYIMLQI
jgi:hypothetical protein